jgi:hypothetical protein
LLMLFHSRVKIRSTPSVPAFQTENPPKNLTHTHIPLHAFSLQYHPTPLHTVQRDFHVRVIPISTPTPSFLHLFSAISRSPPLVKMIFNTIRRAIPGNVLILLAIVAFLALFHSTGRERSAFWYPKHLSEVPFSTSRNVTNNYLPLQKTGPQRGMSVQKPPPPCPACTCPAATVSFSNLAPKTKETEAA